MGRTATKSESSKRDGKTMLAEHRLSVLELARELGRRLRRPRDRQRHPRPDPASRDDDQHPGRLLPVEGQAEVRSGQTDDGGNVSDHGTTTVHPGVGDF